MLRRILLSALGSLFLAGAALAADAIDIDPATACAAGSGQYMTGTIVEEPRYQKGRPLKGVDLSHTHFKINADQTGVVTDVAADNVFASGYENADPRREVPYPLSTLERGQKVSLCGLTYDNPGSGPGIHWVHTNCGVAPSPKQPTGWVRVFRDDGTLGPNLEDATSFCRLWPN